MEASRGGRTRESGREITVPVSVLESLRRELTREVGTLPAVHALHHAGFEAGASAARTLGAGGERPVLDTPSRLFWGRVVDFFHRRGWGTLSHRDPHPGVGILTSPDWAEAARVDDPEGSCSFTAGFLSGLLSEAAGGPVAVLEVDCRTRGNPSCTFAFGSETVIHRLYGLMLDGSDLETALARLS